MIRYRYKKPPAPAPAPAPPRIAIFTINDANNALRHRRLYLRLVAGQFVIDDLEMAGCSFGLPITTPLRQIAALAIEGARLRRVFIRGSEERKAA